MESVARKRKLREVSKNVPLPDRETVVKKVRRSFSKENSKLFQDEDSEESIKGSNDKKNSQLSIHVDKPIACDGRNDKRSICEGENDKPSTCSDKKIQQNILPVEQSPKLSDLSNKTADDSHEDSESDEFFSPDSDSTLEPEDYSSDEADSTLKSNQELIDEDSGRDTISGSSLSEASVKPEFIISEEEMKEHNLIFSDHYIEDLILNELEKESRYYISADYCTRYDINPDRRETLIDWLINVQGHIRAGNNMIHLAVALLDILLDGVPVPVEEMQAASIAAFWVAYKFVHGNLEVKKMTELCVGNVTREMILRYELLVLKKSNFIQIGGDVLVFLNYILYKIYGCFFPHEIYYCGQYLLEIMLLHVEFVNCTSSERAAAAVVTAQRFFPNISPIGRLNIFRFIEKKDLDLMHRHILYIIKSMYGDENNLLDCAVYKKYKSSKYFRISLHENIKKLIKS